MEVYECIFSLITGIGVFILAMKLMSDSLKELAGERMKSLLEKLASNRIAGILIGALVTAVIQSSSATTVMMIGFVNADVMTLKQAAAIIIGSNIGTTATGLLASLESLNVSLYLSMLVFVGVMLSFVKKLKKIANLLIGLGMIFVGLKLMSNACNDDSIKDVFEDILQKINFPLLLELLGMIFTAIIQSSSAMTGIVIVMVGNKVMTMDNGLFITLGANVGTCITALIGIIGANINSKRTAVIHLTFNICGCLIFTPILWIFKDEIIDILDSIVSNHSMQIAYFHLCFNTITALITCPLIDCLVKIATVIIKDEKPDNLIVETMQERGTFRIRESSSSIHFDEENSLRNLNENTIIEGNYIQTDNQYEPPNILEDYFGYKDNKKEDRIKDNESDNDDDKKDNDDHVELIQIEENKNINKKLNKNDGKDNTKHENYENIIINDKDNDKEEENNNEENNGEENNLLLDKNIDKNEIQNKNIEENQNEEKEEKENEKEGKKEKEDDIKKVQFERDKNKIEDEIIENKIEDKIDKNIEEKKK